jgi:hypothetical protein
MKDQKQRGKEIFQAVDEILYKYWNPIGINTLVPRDEYEGYVGGVYRLLASGASRAELDAHLANVELTQIGVGISDKQRGLVIDKLLQINISLGQ